MLYRTLGEARAFRRRCAACAAACRGLLLAAILMGVALCGSSNRCVDPYLTGSLIRRGARLDRAGRRAAARSTRIACFVTRRVSRSATSRRCSAAAVRASRPARTTLGTMMRVVSGIQPTGNLHLGNYLGAIKQWVAMQDAMGADDVCLFFLADLHALSQPVVAERTRQRDDRDGRDAARRAGSIPSARSCSTRRACRRIPSCAGCCQGTARMGWLNRMTQWKDKAGKNGETQSVGLFTYPVLQAADVLALPGDARAGGRGPEAASRTGARHRDQVQPRFRGRAVHAARTVRVEGGAADHVACATARRRCPSPTRRTRRGSI